MITIENLSFTYHKSKRAVPRDFSLSFESDRVYGLLGKDGTGKSTLLYLMSGSLAPKNGKVMFHDTDVCRRLPVTLQDMFLAPEEFELPSVSLVNYIELNSPLYPRFSKEKMIKYFHYFGTDINIDLGSLSMEQKKKVFMSFALATNTSLLLMDEPTNGLDIPGRSQFRKFVASDISDDKTIVISTHQVRDINKVLDRVLIMDDSRVLLDESTGNICDKLFFMESDDRELTKSTLFTIPTIQGNYPILPNGKQDESELNLELLFNAILATPERIARSFHTQEQKTMIKDTFFSLPYFVNLCRKEMVENRKSNVLHMVLMCGVMAVVMVWSGYLQYRYHNTTYFIRHANADPAWEFILVSFLCFLLAFGCLSASLLMEKMKNKTSRLSALVVPSTSFGKFFSRWLISTIIFLAVFLIAFRLADYTRVSIYSLTYSDAKGAILPADLGYLVGSRKRRFLFNEMYRLIFVLSIYCFIRSLFVLGSSVWSRNSSLRAFVTATTIVLIYIVAGIVVGNMLFDGSNSRDCNYIFSSITEQQTFTLTSVAFVLFALIDCTLTCFRLKESEIIQRM